VEFNHETDCSGPVCIIWEYLKTWAKNLLLFLYVPTSFCGMPHDLSKSYHWSSFLYNIHSQIVYGWLNLVFELFNLYIFKQTHACTLKDMSFSLTILPCSAWSYKQMCNEKNFLNWWRFIKVMWLKLYLYVNPGSSNIC
jgi:hypothetical protein